MAASILIADSDVWDLRAEIEALSLDRPRCIPGFQTGELLQLMRLYRPLLTVLRLADLASLDVVQALRTTAPDAFLVTAGDGLSAEMGFAAAKLGVDGFLPKPFSRAQCRAILAPLWQRALELEQGGFRRGRVPGAQMLDPRGWLVGQSAALDPVRRIVESVAKTDATVLLTGESGTGKEVVARMIHDLSGRAPATFVKVNCAAIPSELLESELFGHEAGAFTGASRQHAGKFELADRGTLLLDEIAELHPGLQAKLLHVLQDGEFCRLGADRSSAVQARILAATNVDLEERVRQGRFRPDLLYRLNVISLRLPSLRERREDIPLLADFFHQKYASRYNAAMPRLSTKALRRLERHAWPGNVRELENMVKRYVILGSEAEALQDLSSAIVPSGARPSGEAPPERCETTWQAEREPAGSLLEIGRQAARRAEHTAILAALGETHWNRRQAARMLKISYKALHNKLRSMKLEAETQRFPPARGLSSRPCPDVHHEDEHQYAGNGYECDPRECARFPYELANH